MKVLIGGLGDLGRRCARRWAAAGHQVLGLRRRPDTSAADIEVLAADLAALRPGQFDAIDLALFCAAPDARNETAYRHCYFSAASAFMASVPAAALRILVSSTAVMDGADGEWVDEQRFAPASRWNGMLLAEAEQQLRATWPDLCVLRPSGLYGPGRERLLRKARAGELGEGRYSHRIHIDDCAKAIVHLAALPLRETSYLLTDDAPLPEWQVLSGLAAMFGLPAARRGPAAVGRRLSNARLHANGFKFDYPEFRAGYRAIVCGGDDGSAAAA